MFFKKKPKPAGPIDFLVVGLGNPGKQYEGTRHNFGFAALEYLAEKWNARLHKVKFSALCGEAAVEGQRVLLLMPQTYMNLSGQSVRDAMRFYKLPPDRVLLLFDDVSLPVGTVRIRQKGSDGGQKGMRNIIELTGRDNFLRIKLGIGPKPHPDYDLSAFVLSKFTETERPLALTAVKNAAAAAELMVTGQTEKAFTQYSH